MIYSSILMIILFSNFVSSTHVKNTAEYNERIAWGQYVYTEGAHPYYCSIQAPSGEGYVHICGGSLLNRIMITAAHCLKNTQLIPELRILPNYRNTPMMLPGDLIFKIADYEMYPGANNNSMLPLSAHDIAVVLLDKPDPRPDAAIFSPITPLLRGSTVKMMGFGYTESGAHSYRLKEATVYILDEKECINQTSPRYYSPGHNLCTTNSIGATSCDGDSGGPLVFENPQNHKSYLYGVLTSGNVPCTSLGVTVFVDVLMHLDFINNAIARLISKEMRSDQTEYF